ncbi:hypothetical protein C5F59_004680 [Streptomyces sp. QL37]|uniref:hypothetical protein n=1 Tax=Streptomyces sp. QL37 TaxID=2093747 RepID=UPI000CF26812|nr:hypothetical protein [Streptomyces sp. QL37]PPQ56078.1 hypothetical protein C5F59_04720 [Streptomyces sp. QL37]
MPPKKKPRRPAGEIQRIAAFEGARSKPRTGARAARPQSDGGRTKPQETAPASDRTSSSEADELVDPRSDPEVMFRIISDKIAAKVDKAATKAGASAAQEVSRQLTAELDAAIAGAQSTAGKMGILVQQAVQAAVDETLRTAVLNATRVREEHLAQLALIDRTAQTTQDLTAVQLRIDAEMSRSGLTRVTTADPSAFNLSNPAEHVGSSAYEVLTPAYVDMANGRIVQRGEMRRTAADPVDQEGTDR